MGPADSRGNGSPQQCPHLHCVAQARTGPEPVRNRTVTGPEQVEFQGALNNVIIASCLKWEDL